MSQFEKVFVVCGLPDSGDHDRLWGMKKKKHRPVQKIKLSIEVIPVEHIPLEVRANLKPATKRKPREDTNQTAYRVVQEVIKRSES